MTRPCSICCKPGPATPEQAAAEGWFHCDPDGIAGPLAAVWICGDHRQDPVAAHVIAVALSSRGRPLRGVVA